MKCPKCGFNSFEFLDSCKKCGAEFGSFKQDHRINPVILRSGAALAAVSVPDPVPGPAPAVAADAPEKETDFSRSAPEDSPAPESELALDEDFDFSLSGHAETGPADDSTFNDFSFAEQPEQAKTEQSADFGEAFRDEFSFDETPLDFSADSDKALTETKDYEEDLLDPLSLSAEADKEGENAVLNEFDFSAVDSAAAPEVPAADTVEEEMFSFEETSIPEKPLEKKPPADPDDFDKEFKEIFSFEEQDESDK